MKKKAFIGLAAIIGIIFIAIIFWPANTTVDPGGDKDSTDRPLNLSVYLDLSDRLEREMTPSQADRDTAIIMYLANKLKERAVHHKILPSKERIKIFFYPAPNDPKVALLSEKLELDLAKIPVKEKKKQLLSFEQDFHQSLGQIYESTVKAKNWVGSDIWGFFNKNVDDYCIREGCRNVLVILTDGYIFHKEHKLKDGSSYSYILPETLSDTSSSLIVGRKGLEKLEVLVLEVNPYDIKHEDKMEKVLMDWLKEMGVQKAYVGMTDQPSNTRLIIDKFFDK